MIDSVTEEGTKMPHMIFQAAKVGVNILSVKKLVKNGGKIKFRNDGGTIILPTGEHIPFVIRKGIYFVKLYVLPPDEHKDMPGFGRHGN